MEPIAQDDAAHFLTTVTNGEELLGFVAVDTTVAGRACGGIRLLPDVDAAEIRGLARAMTLKFGFLGLPQGGAKAGVLGDPEAPGESRRERLAAFARAIAPLLRARVFVPHADMGTTADDIRHVLRTAGMAPKSREVMAVDSGYYTAVTVGAAVREALRHRKLAAAGCRVALEGFGKVGRPLARRLARLGARIVAISTSRGALYQPKGLDLDRLEALAERAGSAVVAEYREADSLERHALFELPVDVLCPCARHDSIHGRNVGSVRALVICAGANNPVTEEARRRLFERDVLYVPDFVSNSGGVLGGTMHFASVSPSAIDTFVDSRIGDQLATLLAEADARRCQVYDLAVAVALRRSDRARQQARQPSLLGRALEVGLRMHRRGWVPGALVGRLSLPYFERTAGRSPSLDCDSAKSSRCRR
jgi:glutamate dehydrogenase (NAD(P)+)